MNKFSAYRSFPAFLLLISQNNSFPAKQAGNEILC